LNVAFTGQSAKGVRRAIALLHLKEGDDASLKSQPKKHWKTISQYYRLGAGRSSSKPPSGKKESLRSRLRKWSVMGRPSTTQSLARIDLEGGPKKEPPKSSLRKSDEAKSHLHVMIAPDAKDGPQTSAKKPANKAMSNPYYHGNRSHTHVLVAPDEEGPDPFKEDRHATSLQIMINPNAKDEPNVAEPSEKDSSANRTIVTNPYDNANRPHMGILVSSDGPSHSQADTTMTSLQIMINPNVKQEASHPAQENTNGLPEGNLIKRSPYYQANRPHTNVLISSDGAGPSHSQGKTHMSSLQIMINPNVKDDSNVATNVSPNMKVLISNDGKGEDGTNLSSLQRIMINPNAKDESNIAQQTANVSPHMKVLISNNGKREDSRNMSSLQRIMINPNVRDEEPDLAKTNLEILPAEEKIDINPSSDANNQTANEVNKTTPLLSPEEQGKKGPVEEPAAISDQASEQKPNTNAVDAQTRNEADEVSEAVMEKYLPKKSNRRAGEFLKSKDVQATNEHEKALHSNVKKKKRRATLA
jgi:hypothetical protein